MRTLTLRQWQTSLLYYGGCALLAAAIAFWVLDLAHDTLSIPFVYFSDGLYMCLYLQPFVDHESWAHITRLGAPFSHNLFLFPIGAHVDFAIAGLLALVTGSSGLGINLAWIVFLIFTAVSAAWSLRQLQVRPSVALAAGMAYAFIPYALHHNMRNLNLSIYLVPIVCMIGITQLRGGFRHLGTARVVCCLGVCALLGLNSPYTAFFSCYLFAVVAVLLVVAGQWRASLWPFLSLVIVMGFGVLNLVPSLRAWEESPQARSFLVGHRSPDETNIYAWTLRDAVMPVQQHPIAAFRAIYSASAEAYAPTNHAQGIALGTLGTLGLGLLLLNLLRTCVAGRAARWRQVEDALLPAGALCVALILLAMSGGISNFVALFALDTIRYYWRVAPFIEFFALYALAVVLSEAAASRAISSTWGRIAGAAFLCLLVLLGILDQKNSFRVYPPQRETWYRDVAVLVETMEQRLSAGAMVYQLPNAHFYASVPGVSFVDNYPQLRPYLLSRTLRWSYAPLQPTDTYRQWHQQVERLPLPARARLLLLAGFDAIWLDRKGLADAGSEVEQFFAALPGAEVTASPEGRYVFVDLEATRQAYARALGQSVYQQLQQQVLKEPAAVTPPPLPGTRESA